MSALRMLIPFAAVAVAGPCLAASGATGTTTNKQAVLAAFAQCVLKQAPENARLLLATDIDSKEEEKLAKKLLSNQNYCTDGRDIISMRTGEARGALAEAALKSDPALVERTAKLAPVTVERPTETVGRKFVMAYSRCLAASAPNKARALIITGHGSPEENSAMMAFGESLKDCMPLGFAYNLNIRDVRNHVATALYDRAIASSGRGDPNA